MLKLKKKSVAKKLKGEMLNLSKCGGWFNCGIDFWPKRDSSTARVWDLKGVIVEGKRTWLKFGPSYQKYDELVDHTDRQSPHPVFRGTV